MDNSNHKPLGRFEISRELLMVGDWREILHALMRHVVVVRCDYNPCTDSFTYTALCDRFEEIPPYTEAPWYSLTFVKAHGFPAELNEVKRLDETIQPILTPTKARVRRLIEQA
jgi:hypothetical protein